MRGTKLIAWRIPTVWNLIESGQIDYPKDSRVLKRQKKQVVQTKAVLASISEDMRTGLLETVGIESSFAIDEDRCSIILNLPENSDSEYIARAIDLENVESWVGSDGKVHVGINPWFSTKDVDQSVLCAIKVIHVKLGIHATDSINQPNSLIRKFLQSIMEIMQIDRGSK